MRLIWTVSFNESASFVASAGMEEDRNKNMIKLLNIFLNHLIDVLAEIVKERLQDQGCVQSFRSVRVSVSRSGFVAGGYTLCLKDYVKKGQVIRDRTQMWNRIRHVFFCDNFEPNNRKQNNFVLVAGDDGEGTVHWVVRVLLRFHLNVKRESSRTDYVFLQYREYTLTLKEVDKAHERVCLSEVLQTRRLSRSCRGEFE